MLHCAPFVLGRAAYGVYQSFLLKQLPELILRGTKSASESKKNVKLVIKRNGCDNLDNHK